MAKQLVIFKKGETDVAFTGDETSVAITGLVPGTVVATGDYTIAVQDSEDLELTSTPVDVPGFTVSKAQEEAPENVVAKPTDDGATVTAG